MLVWKGRDGLTAEFKARSDATRGCAVSKCSLSVRGRGLPHEATEMMRLILWTAMVPLRLVNVHSKKARSLPSRSRAKDGVRRWYRAVSKCSLKDMEKLTVELASERE